LTLLAGGHQTGGLRFQAPISSGHSSGRSASRVASWLTASRVAAALASVVMPWARAVGSRLRNVLSNIVWPLASGSRRPATSVPSGAPGPAWPKSTGSRAGPLLLQSRARLRLAQHRPQDALADARAAGERARELGVRHPVVACWRAEAAEALATLGQTGQAQRLAREHLELSEELGTPGARGAARRVLAAVVAEPIPLLEQAVTMLAESPARLEHTRALVALGAALRRVNRRAREELNAVGARPRRSALSGPGALTPAEHRVAQLAAEGHGNRAIAERLYVTQRTVETHLTHVFQKLGISSRAELAAALGGQAMAASHALAG
jgi:DNA-binding CsgD family transcriptional regulator